MTGPKTGKQRYLGVVHVGIGELTWSLQNLTTSGTGAPSTFDKADKAEISATLGHDNLQSIERLLREGRSTPAPTELVCCLPDRRDIKLRFHAIPLMLDGGETSSWACSFTEEPGTDQLQTPVGTNAVNIERIPAAKALQVLFDHAPIGFAFFDRRHRYTRINQVLADINGYSIEDHIGQSIEDLLPVNAVLVGPIIDQVFATGKRLEGLEVDGETAARPSERRSWLTSFYPVFDDRGQVVEVGATAIDITERRRAETALRISETRFRGVFESGVAGFSIFDANTGETLAVNDRLLAMTGHTRDEFENGRWDWREFTPPEFLYLDERAIEQGRANGYWLPYEKQFVRKNGMRIPVRLSSAPLPGEPGRLVGVIDDLTDAKAAESELRAKEEQLRLATEAAEIGLWDVDQIKGTLYWPPRVKAMFGVSAHVPISMNDFYAALHPDDRERVTAAYAAAADPQIRALYDEEYRIIGKEDGLLRWIAAKGRGVFDDNGRCLRMIGTAIDISARKLAEAALKQSEAKLRELNETLEQRIAERTKQLEQMHEALRQAQKMEAVGQLTGGIAHDFNNLLQGILGGFSLILKKPEDQERVKRFAEAGLAAAERGARLTSQLLAFSRTQKIDSKPVVLANVLSNLEEMLARTIEPNVRIKMDTIGDEIHVLGDEVQLEMALLNLAINARDAMPEGGELSIKARTRWLDAHPSLPADHYVELSVSDTGSGMPPDVLSRALDPFFTTKPVGKGTGLGLSQVYGIVHQAGGTVELESEPGKGTTVVLLLKVTDAPSAPHRKQTRSRFTDADTAKVLVVDDDKDVRIFLKEALASLGYVVTMADCGRAALTLLRNHRPDAMIVDFAMPDMNGSDVARTAQLLQPGLPIIFASGYSDTAAVETVSKDAILLRKPFSIEDLQQALRSTLSAQREAV